jgi:hypothetical protein
VKYANRLILDEDQPIKIHLAGAKISTAHEAGSFGFSSREAEADVIEVSHRLDTTKEQIFITRAMFGRMREAFRVLNMHRLKADKAKKTNDE